MTTVKTIYNTVAPNLFNSYGFGTNSILHKLLRPKN